MTPRLNPPRGCRVYGASTVVGSADTTAVEHPAATAPSDNECRLLELEEKIRNQIYDEVTNNIELLGISGAQIVCREPFAVVCKQIRQEFLARLPKHSLPGMRVCVARIKNFDFRRLTSVLRNHTHFAHQTPPPLLVKVYHTVTTEDIDGERLGKWQKFAAQHSGIVVKHTVSQGLKEDESTRQLLWRVASSADYTNDSSEIGKVKYAFEVWRDPGPRKHNWYDDGVDGWPVDGDSDFEEAVCESDADNVSISSGSETEEHDDENDPYAPLFDEKSSETTDSADFADA